MRFDFHFDERALRKTLTSIQRDVMPKAAAGFLNGIAFEAQKALKDHTAQAFDGHVKFTERAWRVEKAKPNANTTSMFSEVRAQPAQAAYLQYQIDGGVRKTGDAGSARHGLFVFGSKTNRAGNIRWGYQKQLTKQLREERSKRAEMRSKRNAARASGEPTSPFAYFRAVRNRPGIFFGDVGGSLGYWQRPKRSKAARRRIPGVMSVRPMEKLKPLLSVADRARYKPRFLYQKQISKALSLRANQASFAHELNRQIRKGGR